MFEIGSVVTLDTKTNVPVSLDADDSVAGITIKGTWPESACRSPSYLDRDRKSKSKRQVTE